MIFASVFGIFVIPLLYITFQGLRERLRPSTRPREQSAAERAAAAVAHDRTARPETEPRPNKSAGRGGGASAGGLRQWRSGLPLPKIARHPCDNVDGDIHPQAVGVFQASDTQCLAKSGSR